MNKAAIQEKRRARRRQQKLTSSLKWGGISIAAIAALAFMVWNGIRPSYGESVPIMPDAGNHVAIGTDPGPFNSNPPTSGRHYGQSLEAGFYFEDSPEVLYDYPDGYLLHNLEHGYVILWYNCTLLDAPSCEQLKGQISTIMDDFNGIKLIAFPDQTIESPLVMTSWGQIQEFDSFDEKLVDRFIRNNRNRSPEPNAP